MFMNIKRFVLFSLLFFSFVSVKASNNYIIENYIRTIELKEKAFKADTNFYKILSGKGYFSLIDSSMTESNLKKYATMDKTNPFAYYVLGEFYRISGNHALSIVYYDSSLAIASDSYIDNLILYRYFKEKGNILYANKALNAMHNVSLNRGVTAYPLLNEYFKYKSFNSYLKNNFINAIQYDNVATELDPLDPTTYIIRMTIHQKDNPVSVLKDIAQYIIVLTSSLKNKIFFYATATRLIYFALFFATFLFVIVLYIKNIDFLAERLYKVTKTKNRLFYYVMLIILLFSPFVWFNNVFYIFILLLLYLTYLRLNKAILYFASFVIMLVVITTIGDSMNLKVYSPDSEISKINSFLQNPWDTNLEQHIIALKEKDKANAFTYDYILALSLKKKGLMDSASFYYEDAYKLNPHDSYLLNNIGNIFYLKGEYDSASSYYSKSIELNPKNAAAHYNLAQYYQNNLELNKASKEMEKAFSLDFDKINTFSKTSSKQYNRLLIDNEISHKFLDNMLKKYLFSGISFNNLFYGINSILIFTIASLFLLFVIFLYNKKKYTFKYRRCDICGHWELENNIEIFEDYNMCESCSEKILNASSESIKHKMAVSMKGNNTRKVKLYGFIINLLIPGSGFVYFGQLKRGFLYIFQFILYLSVAFYTKFIVDSVYDIPLPELHMLKYIFIGIAILLYLISQFGVLSTKESEIKYA